MKNIKYLVYIPLSLIFSSCAHEKKKPNILLLFSDQHNKNVFGFEGHPDVITPNLDKLAEESVVFERAYCSVGISVPSRMSLMSGLYPRTLGLLSNEGKTSVTEKDAISLATVLQMNGYDTYAFGKRHLNGVIDDGWTERKEHDNIKDEDNYVKWITEEGYLHEFALDWSAEFGKGPRGTEEAQKKYPTADLGTRISSLPDGYTMEAFTAKETIKMLKDRKNRDRPFFCWSSFYRPHQPYTPLKKYMDMYDVSDWGKGTKNGDKIKKPKNFYHPTELLPPAFQDQRNGMNKVWNMDKAFQNEQLWRNYIGAYYALVTEIDFWIGEIIKTLEEEGLEDETIIIYTSDHGDFVGNHGMVEKCAVGHNIYEDILNVPLIFKYPGKNKKIEKKYDLVSLVDLFPTLVDLLDLRLPENMKYKLQGQSLVDLILHGSSLNRDYVVSESWSQASVITKDCKLGIWLDPTIVHPNNDYRNFGNMFFNYSSNSLEVENEYEKAENSRKISVLESYYQDFVSSVPDIGKRERVLSVTNK